MNSTQSEEDIFLNAAEIDSSADRAAYVRDACGKNAELRHRVEALLARHHESQGMLDSPPLELRAATEPEASAPGAGATIGPYKLLEQIGEGGMGVVFMAEQERPVRRRVALKIIKPGMDTRAVVARFEAERQALALMDHPNIAKVLDAGTTGEDRGQESGVRSQEAASTLTPDSRLLTPALGRPYFVMELVQGVPITDYCDQCHLPTKERLELFVTVCHAVQHAHQKGIIHRDLKPTNVLVAIQDGQPTPKIIDFGVAKAIGDQSLTERTLTTAFAQMIGTPMYMSPEQAELSPLGVDTRSDIYSLGVMLYELLTGETPFDKDRLHEANYDELRRIIREEEPPRPSTRFSQLARRSSGSLPLEGRAGEGVSGDSATIAANLATTIAEKRRTDPRRLFHTIRGELDWIVMKCLDKDRSRRYESAGELARDIGHYLSDEPVHACPPSMYYRLRKFARRNKTLLATGSAIAAALIVGIGLSTWQYLRADTESARARAASDLLHETLGSDEAKRALRSGASVYHIQQAEALLSHSRTVIGPEDAIRASLGVASRIDEARRHIRQAIESYGRVATEFPGDLERRFDATVRLTEMINLCIAAPGFDDEVDEMNRRLASELPALLTAFPNSRNCQWQAAMSYFRWGKALPSSNAYLATAEHALQTSADILEKYSRDDPRRPRTWLYLAELYIFLGDVQWTQPERSAASFRRAIDIYERHAAELEADAEPEEADGIVYHKVRLAYFLACSHREEEAARFVRDAADDSERIHDSVRSIGALSLVALIQLRLGDYAGYRENCRAIAAVPIAEADDLTKVRSITTWVCGPESLEDMSLPVSRAELLQLNSSLGQRHVVLYVLGAALYRAGQYDRAADRLAESIAAYPSDTPPAHATINFQRLFLAMAKWQQGRHDEARRLLSETQPGLDKELKSSSWWAYRLGLEVLREEAEAMIEPKKTGEALKAKDSGMTPNS